MHAPDTPVAPASPLAQAPMTTILPVRDLERARHFYADTLGLAALGAKPDGKFLFRAGNGALLALFPKADGTKAEHTAASFEVGDIASSIRALEARGVAFHATISPASAPSGTCACWGPRRPRGSPIRTATSSAFTRTSRPDARSVHSVPAGQGNAAGVAL